MYCEDSKIRRISNVYNCMYTRIPNEGWKTVYSTPGMPLAALSRFEDHVGPLEYNQASPLIHETVLDAEFVYFYRYTYVGRDELNRTYFFVHAIICPRSSLAENTSMIAFFPEDCFVNYMETNDWKNVSDGDVKLKKLLESSPPESVTICYEADTALENCFVSRTLYLSLLKRCMQCIAAEKLPALSLKAENWEAARSLIFHILEGLPEPFVQNISFSDYQIGNSADATIYFQYNSEAEFDPLRDDSVPENTANDYLEAAYLEQLDDDTDIRMLNRKLEEKLEFLGIAGFDKSSKRELDLAYQLIHDNDAWVKELTDSQLTDAIYDYAELKKCNKNNVDSVLAMLIQQMIARNIDGNNNLQKIIRERIVATVNPALEKFKDYYFIKELSRLSGDDLVKQLMELSEYRIETLNLWLDKLSEFAGNNRTAEKSYAVLLANKLEKQCDSNEQCGELLKILKSWDDLGYEEQYKSIRDTAYEQILMFMMSKYPDGTFLERYSGLLSEVYGSEAAEDITQAQVDKYWTAFSLRKDYDIKKRIQYQVLVPNTQSENFRKRDAVLSLTQTLMELNRNKGNSSMICRLLPELYAINMFTTEDIALMVKTVIREFETDPKLGLCLQLWIRSNNQNVYSCMCDILLEKNYHDDVELLEYIYHNYRANRYFALILKVAAAFSRMAKKVNVRWLDKNKFEEICTCLTADVTDAIVYSYFEAIKCFMNMDYYNYGRTLFGFIQFGEQNYTEGDVWLISDLIVMTDSIPEEEKDRNLGMWLVLNHLNNSVNRPMDCLAYLIDKEITIFFESFCDIIADSEAPDKIAMMYLDEKSDRKERMIEMLERRDGSSDSREDKSDIKKILKFLKKYPEQEGQKKESSDIIAVIKKMTDKVHFGKENSPETNAEPQTKSNRRDKNKPPLVEYDYEEIFRTALKNNKSDYESVNTDKANRKKKK